MNKVAIISTHEYDTPMDGASIRSNEFTKLLEKRVCVDLYKRSSCRINGRTFKVKEPRGGKAIAAMNALLRKSHYVYERHNGQSIRSLVAKNESKYDVVYGNFIWSCLLLKKSFPNYIDTHNSEFEWFKGLENSAKYPWEKWTCSRSLLTSEKIIRNIPDTTCFIHVSQNDLEYYINQKPHARHVVVPNGCNLYPLKKRVKVGKRRCYFLGSLGSKMNQDSLTYFGNVFWMNMAEFCEFTVYGSSPSKSVISLCEKYGWKLRRNLSARDLNQELLDYEFCVMPFSYSAGSKLKFYDAMGRGMYVLTTPLAVKALGSLPETVLVSDNSSDWRSSVQHWPLLSLNEMNKSQAYAKQFNWESVYGKFLDEDLGPLGSLWRKSK